MIHVPLGLSITYLKTILSSLIFNIERFVKHPYSIAREPKKYDHWPTEAVELIQYSSMCPKSTLLLYNGST